MCDCRSVGECPHQIGMEVKKLNGFVKKFSGKMREKLTKKMLDGYSGWESIPAENIKIMIVDHVKKGDMVDVANLAMFAWFNGRRSQNRRICLNRNC